MAEKKHPKEFAETLKTEAHYCNGFNLMVADISSKSMVYTTNRPKGHPMTIEDVTPGLHVLTNAWLGSPWHKVYLSIVLSVMLKKKKIPSVRFIKILVNGLDQKINK